MDETEAIAQEGTLGDRALSYENKTIIQSLKGTDSKNIPVGRS